MTAKPLSDGALEAPRTDASQRIGRTPESVDSTDIARNHNRAQNTARRMADRWDAAQCPATWAHHHIPTDLFEDSAP